MGYQQKKYKKFVATAATATLVASAIVPVASAKSFSDVAENNEFQPFIDALSDAKIINGYADGTFKPGNKLTRGQVVKMLGRWVESNGTAIPTDWNSKQRFNDVPVNGADEELVKYAALVKDAGVFTGSNGNLMAGNNITRQQMAKVLNGAYVAVNGVSLVELAEDIDNKLITDLSSSQQEFEGYIQALVDLKISTVSVFRPTENVTRAQFAKFLYNTINLDAVVSAGVKAINNTTVEVKFKDAIDNIKDIDFAIEGLKVENAVVKQTDKYTAVLTTAAQEGGKEYTVTVDGKKVGTFTGIAAVIPTKITTTTTSLQGVIGQQVTVKTQVTVAQGQSKENIPVTFNIVNNERTNDKIEVEVLTNAEGVATYSYTRYYDSEDTVTAYATKKSSIYDTAKVYWANKIQLAVSEITTGNELANETKKSYKVTGEKNKTYYVAIKENLNVAPDKVAQVKVQNHGSANFVTPVELTTGGTQFATVTTNSNGEGTFTVYGSNLSATPIVYAPETTPVPTTATSEEKVKYNKLDLQAQAPTVKFSQINRLALTVKAEGTANSAQYAQVPVAYDVNSAGGRTYTVTVTDKDGKLAPAGTVAYVTFEKDNIVGDVYFTTGTSNFVKVGVDSVQQITVGKDGKAQFRVAGTGATTYVKPTVFLNTAGSTSPVKLEKTGSTTDVHQVAEVTYFKAPVVTNAVLSVKDQYGRTITSLNAGQDAYFTYQSVDQNGFAYRPTTTTGSTTQTVWKPVTLADGKIGYVQETVTVPGGTTVTSYTLAFDVTSTFGNAIVKDAAGVTLPAVQNLGNTKTYHVKSDADGKAIVRVTSESADTVSANVTGASNILPTKTASVSFINSTLVPDVYSGTVKSYDSKKGMLTFDGKQEVDIYGTNILYTKGNEVIATYDAFIDLLKNATGTVSITRTVKDGVTTFNIYNIATTGAKPVDTATAALTPAPVTNAAFTDTDKDENQIAGEITFTASTSTNVTTKVYVGTTEVVKDANGKYIVTADTAKAEIKIVVTDNKTGQKAQTTVTYTDLVDKAEVQTVTLKQLGFTTTENMFNGTVIITVKASTLPAELKGKKLSVTINGKAVTFVPNSINPDNLNITVQKADFNQSTFEALGVTAQ